MKDIPAFPLMGVAPEDSAPVEFHGMTLRDYFAAMAMNAYLSKCPETTSDKKIACWSYEMADAMLKVREK